MKRLTCLLLCILLAFSFSASIYAVETRTKLSEMSDMECLRFIKYCGVDVPTDYADETIWAPFVKQTIIQVEDNPHCIFLYNYTVTEKFAEDIREVVNDYYGITTNTLSTSSAQTNNTRYVLGYSTPIGDWSPEYQNYNCYAYAVEYINDKYSPGEIYNMIDDEFRLNNTLVANYELIRMDLLHLGYHCIRINPNNIGFAEWDDGYRVICFRFSTYDFHFMRMDSSFWSHKPGESQPLRFNEVWPYDHTFWCNEGIYDGEVVSWNTNYNSPVQYISYCIPEVQYIGNNRHAKHCPGCDADIVIEKCTSYTYCGNSSIGDYHKLGCPDCGNTVSSNMTQCCYTWIPYGIYNGVPCHIRGCIYCRHTDGGIPKPCTYSAPGMCDSCG